MSEIDDMANSFSKTEGEFPANAFINIALTAMLLDGGSCTRQLIFSGIVTRQFITSAKITKNRAIIVKKMFQNAFFTLFEPKILILSQKGSNFGVFSICLD